MRCLLRPLKELDGLELDEGAHILISDAVDRLNLFYDEVEYDEERDANEVRVYPDGRVYIGLRGAIRVELDAEGRDQLEYVGGSYEFVNAEGS